MKKSKKQSLEAEFPTYKSWRELPHIPISRPSKGSIGNTGEWRTFRPVIDEKTCNKCGLCYLYCPDGVIIFKDGSTPEIDYTYCKGCGICATICPKKALSMVIERQ
jgi:pyruvate ferredoxin oxidoreductase delta subunit